MLFLLFAVIATARLGEESLIRSLEFRKNNIELSNPIYPPFAGWDSKYTGLFDLTPNDTLEINATAVFPYPKLYISINNSPWQGLGNKTYTAIPLTQQSTTVTVLSTYYNKYHEFVNYTYEVQINLNAFTINASFQSASFNCSASSRDNNCSTPSTSSDKSLNFTINSSPAGILTVRRVNYVSSDDYSSVSQNVLFNYLNFFANLLENVLEVTVSSPAATQVFFFRFTQAAGAYDLIFNGASFNVPVDFSGWDLMPRFHPQVNNYTLVPKLPSLAFGNMRFIVQSGYVSVCFLSINPLSPVPHYTWPTNNPSSTMWMYIKEDVFNFYCASPDLAQTTSNYTVSYYRKSNNYVLTPIRAFLNPLIESVGDFSSNSSDLPGGFNYKYDLSTLNTWDALNNFTPPAGSLLTYPTFTAFLTFDPIEYPSEPTGITFLFIPVDPDGYFTYNLAGGLVNSDYFFSSKSVYPLQAGKNFVIVNFTAEDRNYKLNYKFTVLVLDPDTSFQSLSLNETLEGVLMLGVNCSDLYVPVPYHQENVTMTGVLNNSNATFEIIKGNSIVFQGNSSIDLVLTIESEFESTLYTVKVSAESRNWEKNYSVNIVKIDLCGDGRRWNSSEQCDDGNDVEFDGCFGCLVETNWSCSGGSFNSSDVCVKDEAPVANLSMNSSVPSTNGTGVLSNNTGALSNSSSDLGNLTESQENSTDNSANSSGALSSFVNGTGQVANSSYNESGSDGNKSSEVFSESQSVDESFQGFYPDGSNKGNNKECEEQKVGFLDSVVPYFFIAFPISAMIAVGHVLTKLCYKNFVRKFLAGGINMGFVPMLWTFQSFYMIANMNRVRKASFFSSFFWSFLSPLESFDIYKQYAPVIYTLIALVIYSFLSLFLFLLKYTKKFKGHKSLSKILNTSALISVFNILSPVLLFVSTNYLLSASPKAQNTFLTVLSILDILSIISTLLYFLYLCTKHSCQVPNKENSPIEPLFQGLAFSFKTLPVTCRSESTKLELGCTGHKNTLIKKPKKRNSQELEVSGEKPKFFSCPWKQSKMLEESTEIPEFNLIDPLEGIETDKTLVIPSRTLVQSRYYVYSLGFCYGQTICLALGKDFQGFLYVLVVLKVLQTVFLFLTYPFASVLYNRFHVALNFSLGVLFLFISIIDLYETSFSFPTLAVGSIIVIAYWLLNLYEIYSILKKALNKYRKSRNSTFMNNPRESNECSKIIENPQNEVFFTEPLQTNRIVTHRNCLSFIEPDIEEI